MAGVWEYFLIGGGEVGEGMVGWMVEEWAFNGLICRG